MGYRSPKRGVLEVQEPQASDLGVENPGVRESWDTGAMDDES